MPLARHVHPASSKVVLGILTMLTVTVSCGSRGTDELQGAVPDSLIRAAQWEPRGSVCALHGDSLVSIVVPIAFGWRRIDSVFDNAASDLFPHADSTFSGGCVATRERYSRVYRCPTCIGVKRLWLADHPEYDASGERRDGSIDSEPIRF